MPKSVDADSFCCMLIGLRTGPFLFAIPRFFVIPRSTIQHLQYLQQHFVSTPSLVVIHFWNLEPLCSETLKQWRTEHGADGAVAPSIHPKSIWRWASHPKISIERKIWVARLVGHLIKELLMSWPLASKSPFPPLCWRYSLLVMTHNNSKFNTNVITTQSTG